MSRLPSSGSLERVQIAALNPFWRWAIIPLSLVGEQPALPYFRRRSAEDVAHEFVALFGGGVVLLRRRGLRGFELAGQIR